MQASEIPSSSLFTSNDYRQYVRDRLTKPEYGGKRGEKSRFATAIGCQGPYLTLVLADEAHLTMEQAEEANSYFGHTADESDFFLNLVEYGRSGTRNLKQRLQRRLQTLRDQQLNLKSRLRLNKQIAEEDQAAYYASSLPATLHALLSVPQYSSAVEAARALNHSLAQVTEVCNQLVRIGVYKIESHRYVLNQASVHLGQASQYLTQHHINWRLEAIKHIQKKNPSQLHYSSVVSLSHEDRQKLHELFIQTIQTKKEIVRKSKEESVSAVCLDFFTLV